MIDIFHIYAALSRLAVIGAGFGCIVMGYRLFVLGVMPQSGSDIDVKYRETRLTIKNAAPGTVFAIVGLAMILAMLVQGNPERTTKYERSVQRVEQKGQDNAMRGNPHEITATETTTVTERGGSEDIFTAIERGRQFEQIGQTDKAIASYAKPLENGNLSLKNSAEPLRAIAAVYLKQGRYDEARAYATLAYNVDLKNAAGLALIARIEFHRGKYEKASEAMSKAAEMDSDFTSEYDEMKKKIKNVTNQQE